MKGKLPLPSARRQAHRVDALPAPGVILLNGCTSAGKSSIAAELSRRLPTRFLTMGIDDFIGFLPVQLHGNRAGLVFEPQPDGSMPLRLGPAGCGLERAFHKAVRAACCEGFDVIVDDVIFEPWLWEDWQLVLDGLPILRVGVTCALDELERRERARGDRRIGQARSQFHVVHETIRYDLVVDSAALRPSECADAIMTAWIERRAIREENSRSKVS